MNTIDHITESLLCKLGRLRDGAPLVAQEEAAGSGPRPICRAARLLLVGEPPADFKKLILFEQHDATEYHAFGCPPGRWLLWRVVASGGSRHLVEVTLNPLGPYSRRTAASVRTPQSPTTEHLVANVNDLDGLNLLVECEWHLQALPDIYADPQTGATGSMNEINGESPYLSRGESADSDSPESCIND